jgi:hypothetical protein
MALRSCASVTGSAAPWLGPGTVRRGALQLAAPHPGQRPHEGLALQLAGEGRGRSDGGEGDGGGWTAGVGDRFLGPALGEGQFRGGEGGARPGSLLM